METDLPTKRKPKQDPSELKTSDILSFSSALIAVATSAILYLAGWFYLANWYAFFGLDASQIDLPAQIVILHGLPSIIIVILAGFLSASAISTLKLFIRAQRLESRDIPTVVITAYIIAFLMMMQLPYRICMRRTVESYLARRSSRSLSQSFWRVLSI